MQSLNTREAEGEIVKTVFVSLTTSFLLLTLLYFIKLRYIEDFLPKYAFFLFFITLSYALILPALRHVRAYKEFPCMSGMMIGMTVGMIAGFLPGFYIAATNGMFWGAIVGIVIGISLGAWKGSCCGIMGFMEGTMAGFMGSLMGAMTAIMFYNDHLKASAIIIFLIAAVIMVGLHYMIYKETREIERRHKDSEFFVMFFSLILTSFTTWMMVFGPRSLLFQ